MIRIDSLFNPHPQATTLDSPLDHLMACHRRVEERLEMMGRAAAHLGDQREAALEAFAAAFRFMDTSGTLHTADEEESLFRRLMPLLEGGERDYLSGLEHDHMAAHGLYTDLKAAVSQVADEPEAQARVSGLVERLTQIYRRHIASEDEVLQAIARQRLSDAQIAEIAREMKRRRA